jgi:hypothetical protein
MTEILKFIVTLPADVIPKLETIVRIRAAVGGITDPEIQIAAAIAMAAHSKVSMSAHLPGLAVARMDDEEKPECTCGPCEPTCDHTDPEVCNSFPCPRHDKQEEEEGQ